MPVGEITSMPAPKPASSPMRLRSDRPLISTATWPEGPVPQQLHLDFGVVDLDAGEAHALSLGATKAGFQPGTTFRVFLDPVGHPFCLVLEQPS